MGRYWNPDVPFNYRQWRVNTVKIQTLCCRLYSDFARHQLWNWWWKTASGLYYLQLCDTLITHWHFLINTGDRANLSRCQTGALHRSSAKSDGLILQIFVQFIGFHCAWHSGDNQSAGSSVPVVSSSSLWPGNTAFLEYAEWLEQAS